MGAALSQSPMFDFVIIGAGLSGLASAVLLHDAGKSVCLLDAGLVPGGRIQSVYESDLDADLSHATAEKNGAYLADLGPTWIWPAYQPVVRRWLDKLGLQAYEQFDAGQGLLDQGPGQSPQAVALHRQEGSVRIVGGPQAIIDALVFRLPPDALRTNARATTVQAHTDYLCVQTDNATCAELRAAQVIVAVPARQAVSAVAWQPGLPARLLTALASTPTWMAPHAKVVAVYEQAFWRSTGLSGRIVSRHGPLAETHDHCGVDGMPAAIFGFMAWPPALRAERAAQLKDDIRAQLSRCFGPNSPSPVAIVIKDWAQASLLATAADLAGPAAHPVAGPAVLRERHWEARLSFAVSETAQADPGLIAGAFEAAERIEATVL